jgi:hypothetical protein
MNDIVDQVNGLTTIMGSRTVSTNKTTQGVTISVSDVDGRKVVVWDGVVVSTGPSAEADYTDSRYWVKPSFLDQGAGVTETSAAAPTAEDSTEEFAKAVTVTNLAELPVKTHGLRPGQAVRVASVYGRVSGTATPTLQHIMWATIAPATFKARITAVTGSFPVWTYTVQRLVSINTANTDATRRVTDGVNLTAKNGMEWTPAAYPYIHGNGLKIANSSGAVATTFAGSTASTCLIRSIAVGAVVDVTALLDQSGNVVYEFTEPNSAQA